MSITNGGLSSFAGSDQPHSPIRQALPQILAVCVKNVLLLGFGMTLGFPTILIPSLSGNNPEERFHLGQEAISWIGSINLICVPVGCLLSGPITQPIGRKRAMQYSNIPFLAAWLLFYFSTQIWHVFLALAITGVTGGLLEAPVLTYVAEITEPSLRGILSATSGIAVIGGILMQFSLGTFLNWRPVALISCASAIASFVLLFCIPESPHWLIMNNRLPEAQKSIAWFRGWSTPSSVLAEYDQLCQQLGYNSDGQCNTKKLSLADKIRLFAEKRFYWPFALVGFCFFLSNFTGTSTLQVYAVNIFSTLQVPINKYHATVMLGVAEILGCIACTCIIHRLGKRVVNFIGLLGCGTGFFLVAVYANYYGFQQLDLTDGGRDEVSRSDATSWTVMLVLVSTAFFTHMGIKTLPWLLTGEVYYSEIRAMASGISGALSYVFGFIGSKLYLSMVDVLTLPGMFWFYSAVCFTGTAILYFVLPETEGKTLYNITEHFAGATKLTNTVQTYSYKQSKKKRRSKIFYVNSGFTPNESRI